MKILKHHMCIRYLVICSLISLTTACTASNKCITNSPPLSLEELSLVRLPKNNETYKTPAFLGAAYRVINTDTFKKAEVLYGYIIDRVIPGSTAAELGLLAGDIIIEFDGIRIDSLPEKERKQFLYQYVRRTKEPGDKICLKVLRQTTQIKVKELDEQKQPKNKYELEQIIENQQPDKKLSFTVDKESQVLHLQGVLGERKNLSENDVPSNQELFPKYEKLTMPHIEIMKKLINFFDLQSQYEDLILRYKEDELWEDEFRLNLFRYLHRDPFKLIPVVEEVTSQVEGLSKSLHLSEIISESAGLLDVSISPNSTVSMPQHDGSDILEYIVQVINRAWELRLKAFEKISSQDAEYLGGQLMALLDRFAHSTNIERNNESEDKIHNKKIIELAQLVDFSILFQSAEVLSQLTDPEFIVELRNFLEKEGETAIDNHNGVQGTISYLLSTKAGPVIIGGSGQNVYKVQAAAIIDLGGDDLYIGDVALVEGKKNVSVILDLGGNDQYLATEYFAQGSAMLGVSLLADISGDDLYIGTRFSQGSAVVGVGILQDFEGDDKYYGEEFNQGIAFWGAGILIDASGDDYYQSNLLAQGVGGVKGFGALLDNAGSDFYFAGGRDKSSYGTSGVFQGLSQGLGVGFRGYVSGGIGMLLDGGGDDRFWAGNFSQGTGYFFGIGIIRNFGTGNDFYTASRYGQGASAHSAAGILFDDAGNDHYEGYQVALQGAAWDLGIAALVDKKGDDSYHGLNWFSQAASSHNGIAFLYDDTGYDQYWGNQARAGNNEYHGGSSFSFFIDGGGQQDIYSDGDNNSITTDGEYGIRADLKDNVENTFNIENYVKHGGITQ